MKKKWLGIVLAVFLLAACGTPAPAQPGVETVVAETLVAMTSAAPPVETPAEPEGALVSANSVKFVIPVGLGTSANVESLPEAIITDGPMMASAPAHTKFTLTGYPLQGKFFEPNIYVYPVAEYEAINDSAAQNIQKLRAILASPEAPLTKDALPGITAFNAAKVFTAKMQLISFQSGSGVIFLTQYAQYPATVNNKEMFYNFQGLTSDGRFYIVAILPVNAPFLAPDDNPQSVLPSDGIPLTTEMPDDAYYAAVVSKLDQTAPDVFMPTLTQLDALIQSITIQ